MAQVVFDWNDWSSNYPSLAALTTQALATGYFSQAALLCDNGPCSRIPYNPPTDTTRQTLLWLLVAHIVALNDPARAGMVGRVGSASQGSVNVRLEYYADRKGAWYNQTQWGAMYWQMTITMRMGRYRPGPQPFYQPPFGTPQFY